MPYEPDDDDIPTLPAELVSPTEATKFCESCQKFLPVECFLKKPRHRCKFCVGRDRALSHRSQLSPEHDPLLQELSEELKSDRVELPTIRDILNEFVVQEGGVKKSIQRIRRVLTAINKKNPRDRFPVTVRMGFIKLFMALEAVDKKKEAPESPLAINEAYAFLNRMFEKFDRERQPALTSEE